MKAPGIIDQIIAAARSAFPAGAGAEAENNFRGALQSLFARMDLVTREEFEVQQQVLARTRALLDKLEKQIAELEQRLDKKN